MKPCAFEHHVPGSLAEALTILAEVAEQDGRILAGGQTLVPAMALRLARPAHLVDINGIAELARLQAADGWLRVGATVRHSAFERGRGTLEAGVLGDLLACVVRHIAHLPIRTRGTLCGSLANADPASEWCLMAATLDAELVLMSVRGTRTVGPADYFFGYMATALEPDEMLAEVRLPLLPAGTHFGFYEFSRRAGDFAQAMALAVYQLEGGRMCRVRLGIGGVEGAPRRIAEAEAALEGQPPCHAAFAAAAEATRAAVEPTEIEDEQAAYKRDLAGVAARRALDLAAASRKPGEGRP